MNRVDALFGDEAMGYTAPVAKGAALGYPEQQHGGFTDLLGAREEMGRASLEELRYLQMGGGRKTHMGGRKMRKSRKTQSGGRRRTTTKQGRKPFLNLRVTGQIRMKQRHRQ